MPTIIARSEDALTATMDALLVALFEGETLPADLAARFDGQLSSLLEAARFRGKRGELAAYATFGRLPARWIVLTGLGERGAPGSDAFRRAFGAAVKRARDEGARSVAALLPEGTTPDQAQAAVEGMRLALYRFTRYKSAPSEPAKDIDTIELWAADERLAADAIGRGQAVAEGVAVARDLVNTISDDKTPAQVAELAEQLAEDQFLDCTVLTPGALQAGGYNSILTVGKGSVNPPHLIELTYNPSGAPTKTVALVGKTMTFDAGGLDLKTAQGMHAMKNDLGGGAAVLGVMRVIAALRPNVRVIGILTTAENMPSGSAMRPRDIVKALNGKTYEIGNTDAEGRMVLADAVTHAARAGADEIISVATLTGGVLGRWGTCALGNDPDLRDRFLKVAETAGERVWPLPNWEEFRTELESDIADFKSVGDDWGGDTIRASLFISEFVEGKPWLHLDIAMVADTDTEGPYQPRGATGVMVRSLVRYLEEQG